MIDYGELLYNPVYAEIGVIATFTVVGMTEGAVLTVIDDTRPKSQPAGSAEVRGVGPGAYVRIPELTENGITRDLWIDAKLTFNGRSWIVRSYELRGSPNGEDLGEVRFFLKKLMIDVREDILARLFVIVGTIPNIKASYRNNIEIPEGHLPAAIVLDGDEGTDDISDLSMHPSNKPIAVQMVPEIIIAEQAENVGTDITTLRRELIKRVLFDTVLNEQIVKTGRHGNGAIRYLGCQTDLGWMRSLHGALLARFMFKYFLKPNDL